MQDQHYSFTLPVRREGHPVKVHFDQLRKVVYATWKQNTYYFVPGPMLVYGVYVLAAVGALLLIRDLTREGQSTTVPLVIDGKDYSQDALGYSLEYFDGLENFRPASYADYREQFLVEKQLLISQALIKNKVNRLDQLDDPSLVALNKKIGELFTESVLKNVGAEPHVYAFFSNNDDLFKIETALMEQIKFHVPASIKLGQAALETAYGRRVLNNNYFGIKDKTEKTKPVITTEYYNAQELRHNKHKVLSQEKVVKDGQVLYRCKVKDSFTAFSSPWESFRAHSVFLNTNERYSPLFTKGKDYKAWADKIGSTKYGGVGYATSPIYGQLLKKIIDRYGLDLLDY